MKFRTFLLALVLPVVLCALTKTVPGQSSDQRLPTAVLSNEIRGTIAALDVGDPRLTRHFYAFEGVPGDLLITVNSRNLNGDMDVFTAVTFRPLMKIPIYSNTIVPEVTKSIYLRTRQILILRVEARTPNDDDGSYHVRFGGAFEAFSGGIPVAEKTEASSESASSNRGTRRLSSVGATIAQPPTETPATSEPKSSGENPAEKANTAANAKKSSPKSARTKPGRSTPSGRNTRRRPSTPARSKPATPSTESAKSSTQTESGAAKKEGEEQSSAVSTEKTATAEKPAAQETPAPQPGPHLIIEKKDGTRIDRPMSSVRRVLIEGGVIGIVLKTGRIERVPMSAVVKMTIEP